VNLERALLIDGWMEQHDLEWLAKQAATHQRIVEVGCWMGRSTMALADNTPGVVWAIDHWNGSEEHQNNFRDNADDPDWLAKIFFHNLGEHIISGKVVPRRMPSVAFAEEWLKYGKVPFDMTFIDASHDYASVKADIVAWRPITKGLLCGHDAGHGPIMDALRELLPGYRTEESMWLIDV
jgi:Methyltransferase domain